MLAQDNVSRDVRVVDRRQCTTSGQLILSDSHTTKFKTAMAQSAVSTSMVMPVL